MKIKVNCIFLLVLAFTLKFYGQTAPLQLPCTNLGFESGTTGWFGTTGHVTNGVATATSPVYNINVSNSFGIQTSIVTAGIDTFGNFPLVFSGTQSLRIGDATGSAAQGASVEQYFQVTASNTNFTYNYACVLEDGGHPNFQQPFFQVDVFDQSGNPITCGNYLIVAPGTGWMLSTTSAWGILDVYYKPWTTVSINLLPYVGQNITVRFTSGDCTQGGHFGYAYIDCSCAPYTIAPTSICQGQSVILTAPPGAMTYSWSPGGQTTSSISVNPTSTTFYTCTITSQGTTPCIGTYTTSVTVAPSPTVTVNSATICPGNSATLTASGATTYSWTPATGLSSTTGTSVTANPNTTTTYSVIGITGICSDTVTSVVTISPTPTITVNSPAICIGNNTTLNASGASTYTWFPSTGLSVTTGASVTANPTVTTTYTITGTATTCTSNVTAIVTVNPLPTITVNSATICPGSSTTLSANGASTYSWTPSSTLNSSTGSSVTANPTVTTTYTITGTSLSGCVATTTAVVTIGGNISPTVNSASLCVGGSTTLNASGATTYTWSPGTGLSSTNGASVSANPTITTTYTLNAASGICTGTVTSTVIVNPLPTITVNSGTICIGQNLTLNAGGASTYSWIPATGLNTTNGASVSANPILTTNYTVTGLDLNGCVNTNTTSVTVNLLPTITVNNALLCNGGSATLNANGASTYSWSPGTGLSSTTGASVSANPNSTTNYTITGTDINGCINSNTTSVIVVTNPTITVSPATICLGNSTTLNASGAGNYFWSPATGLNSTNGNTVIANPTATTVYTITGTIGTCTAIATTTVTVNPLPIIALGSNSPVCVNQNLNLISAGGTNYIWTGPNNFSSIQQNPNVAGVTLANAGIYSVTVTDLNFCTNTATVPVVINSLPLVTASGNTVCVNSTINLNATGGVNYSWSGPNSFSSNQQNPSIANSTINMSGNYFVVVTDANGCSNGNSAQVTINQLPIINVASGIICAGSSTSLNASGANLYSWSPTTGLNTGNGASVTAHPNATTVYNVTGTDLNGCQNIATLTLTVSPLPLVTIGPHTTSGCAPVCANFSNTATGNGNCNWNFGDGTVSTSCNAYHCFTKQGAYSVMLTLTDNNGCVNSSSATVLVYPNPIADFNFNPPTTTILEPQINFYNLSSTNSVNWNWSFGNSENSVSNLQNPTYTYSDPGSYPVQLIVTTIHGCKDSILKIIVIDDENMIYVPNAFTPNSDGTNDIFCAKGEGIKDFSMYIFDRWGNQVFHSDNIFFGWDGRYHLQGTEIVQEDVYVWKIECKNTKGQSKILKGTVSLLK